MTEKAKSNHSEEITAFKGFDNKLQCRGFQFEVGKTFNHEGEVEACSSGFHACEYPLDVFGYYAPADSRFASVKASGSLSRRGDDSKVACASITIEAEIGIPTLVAKAVAWIMDRVDNTKAETNTGYQSAATNTGYRSAATNTGDRSAATNTGYQSAATNTGDRSAATNTGYQSAATNTGYRSAAAVEGESSVAISVGIEGKAKAAEGSAIVLCYRDEDSGEIIHIRASKVGDNGVRPGVWYRLNENGDFLEIES